jgi:hypothetical protein
VADAHRDNGKRFVVRADEKLTAYRYFFADKSQCDRKNPRMSSQKTGLRVASVIFGIFAIGHVLRLVNQSQVTIGTHSIPMGVSWVALIIAAILCIWMWRLSKS